MTTATGSEAITFLQRLHGRNADYVELRVKDPAGTFRPMFFPAVERGRIAAEAERFSQRCDVYIGIGARDGKGGTRENTTSIGAVWADCDCKNGLTEADFRKKLAGLPPPSMIVRSGGGLHFYWLLREPAGPEDFERVRTINQALAAILGGDSGACDPARILRLPGTLNHKREYGTPRPVRLLEANDAEYNLSDFDLYTPAGESLERRKAAPIPEVINEREGIGRHNTLTSLAGSMRHRGATAAEIFPALVEMNKRCSPPLAEKDLRHIAESMQRYPAGAPASSPAPVADDRRPSREIMVIETMRPRTAEELILDTSPQPPRLIEGMLYLQNLLTIAGPPKSGKSWLALLLMLCLVSGRPFLGYLVPRKYRVLYLFAEGGEYPFKQRLEQAIGHFPGLADEDMQRFRLLFTAGRVKVDNPTVEDALLRWSEESDVICIDPHYKFIAHGEENSNTDSRVFLDVYSRLMAAGKTLVVVHHTRKAGAYEDGINELRGAGLAPASDAVLILNKKKYGINVKYRLKHFLRHFPEPDELELTRSGGLFELADVGRPIATVADLVTVIREAGGEVIGRDTLRQAVERHTGNAVSVDTMKRVIQSAEGQGAVRVFPNPGRGGKTRYEA